MLSSEHNAIQLSKDKKRLLQRLNSARAVLIQSLATEFKKWSFDFENKRLISASGVYAIQWKLRDFPDSPVCYENQQTDSGICIVVRLKSERF